MRALTSNRCTTPIPLIANTPPSLSLLRKFLKCSQLYISTPTIYQLNQSPKIKQQTLGTECGD